MKKTYISPVSKVVRVGVAQMMATSLPGVTMNSGNNTVNANEVDVREDNGWDIWDNEDASE